MDKELRTKTVKAIGHLGLGGSVGKVISLGTTLIMARLLSPADYGLMSIAMLVISFVGFFNEVGIGSAIVQREKMTDAEVNGCFAIAVMASIALFLLTAATGGLVADFFGNPKLRFMMPVLAVEFVFGAFATVPLAFLRKEMHFKSIAGVTVLSVIVQSIISVALAATGHGVWSLVWGSMAATIVLNSGFFLLAPWRPRGRYGIREAGSLVMYGLQVTNTRIFWYLYTNADKVIIGKLLKDRALGIYDMAFSLATLPSGQITTLVTNVASPLFSKLQNDSLKLTAVILNLTRGIAYVTYPALIGMLACSRELVPVILGEKWLDTLIPFGALCLMGLVKSVDPLLSQTLISIGHAKKLAAYTLLCGVVMSLAVVVGALADGLQGVSLVWVIVYPLLSAKLLHDVCKLTGMKMWAYYKNLWPVLKGAIAMAVVVLVVRELTLLMNLPVVIRLGSEIACGAISYILWIVYVDRHGLREIRQVMLDLGIAEGRLDRWPFNRVAAL